MDVEFDNAYANSPFDVEQGNDPQTTDHIHTHHGLEFLDKIEDKFENWAEGPKHSGHVKGVEHLPKVIWVRNARPDGIRVRTYTLAANVPLQIADRNTDRYRITISLTAAGNVSIAETNNGLLQNAAHSALLNVVGEMRTIETVCDVWAISTAGAVIDVIEEYYTNARL